MNITLIRPGPMAGILGVLVALVLVTCDFGTWIELNVAVVYSVPLVFAAASGSRRLLWSLALTLIAITFAVYFVQIPSVRQPVQVSGEFLVTGEPYFVDRALAALTILLTAAILQGWLHALRIVAARDHAIAEKNLRLEEVNREMMLHKEALLRQNVELQQRRGELEEISRRKTQMLAAISHDIRTPLQSITLVAEVMRRTAHAPALEERIPALAQRVQSHALAVAELLAEVMDLASFDSGKVAVHPGEFRLQDLLLALRERLLPLAEEKGLKLVVEAPREPIVLCTDKVKLGRILGNLIGNAVKFTRTGSVTLAAGVTGERTVRIAVTDTGCGIQPENLERIFGDYMQEDRAQVHAGSGWGLGLSISRRMSALIGGDLRVESRPGAGSTFTVTLPASALAPASDADAAAPPDAAPSNAN